MKESHAYYILSYVILLCLLVSCKLYENKKRDKWQETEMEWQHLEQRWRQYSIRKDTLSSRWYFWTDSAFHFHPDSGLFAQSGSLLGLESKGSIGKQMQDLAAKNEMGKQKKTRYEKSTSNVLSAKHVWAVFLVLVLLFGWRWNRSRRRV